MSDDETFVNRRGRKATLDEDLTAIEIEEKISVPISQKQAKTRRQLPRLSRPDISSKRTKIIVGVVVAVLLVPLAAAELLAWQYRSNAKNIQSETVRIGNEVALPKQKEKKFRDGLDRSTNELSSMQQDSCRGGLFDNAASLYPRAKSALAECNEANQGLSALVRSLNSLQEADDYAVKAQAILKTPLAPTSEAFAVIPDQIAAWNTAATKTKELREPPTLSVFHASLTQAVQTMADGWSELNAANNARDQAGFDAAEKKLTEGYAALRDLSAELTTQLNQLQTQIDTKYKAVANPS